MHTSSEQWIIDILRDIPAKSGDITASNLEEIGATARAHGVLSLVLYLLDKNNDNIELATLFSTLKQQSFQHIATDLLLDKERVEILALFTAANLPFLLMKGEVLAHSHYPEPHTRERCDTDILFADKESAEQAWNILKNRGYRRRNTLTGQFVGYQYSCYRELAPDLNISLDIHNKLSDYLFFANAFDFDELNAQAMEIPQLGPGVRGLGPVYLLLHACLHRVSNMPQQQENRLIWIYDIHLLCNAFNEAEWRQFSDLAIQKGLAGVCADGLRQSQRLLLTEITDSRLHSLEEHAKKETFSPLNAKNRWGIYYRDFLANPGVFNKMRQIREHLFPSVEYMQQKYQPGSVIYLPYYYVKRVIGGIGRYF